jgi:hypothetical protein
VRIAGSQSARHRTSHSASATRALSAVYAISRVRSSGIVHTTTPPAFSTANQHAAISGVLGARSSTRLPGTTRRSSTSACAIRLAVASSRA